MHSDDPVIHVSMSGTLNIFQFSNDDREVLDTHLSKLDGSQSEYRLCYTYHMINTGDVIEDPFIQVYSQEPTTSSKSPMMIG